MKPSAILIVTVLTLAIMLSAVSCEQEASVPELTNTPDATSTPALSPTSMPTPTPTYTASPTPVLTGEPTGTPTPGPIESGLVSNCYDWPAREFSPANRADLQVAFAPGDTAMDFTLRDADGHTYSLYSLLETKPVLIVFGAYT